MTRRYIDVTEHVVCVDDMTTISGDFPMTNTPLLTKQFLTDDVIRNLSPPATGMMIFMDDDAPGLPGTGVPGFGVRITATGFRAFIIRYRARETGKQPVFTIGRFPLLKTERARERARNLRVEIEEGRDPQAERAASRAEPTVNQLADRFEAEHLPMKRPSTAVNYRTLLRLHMRPAIGRMRVNDVALADIEQMHRSVTKGLRQNKSFI